MVTISTMFAISKITDSLTPDGQPQSESLTQRIGSFLDELEWYEESLQRQRQIRGTPF